MRERRRESRASASWASVRSRDDVPSAVLHIYLDLVLDGLVARLASGEDPKNLSAVLDLVEASVRQQRPASAEH